MKYAADRRTLIFLAGIFCFQAALFSVNFKLHPWLYGIPLVALNSFFVFILSLINHNQRHVPIFENQILNQAINLSISFMMGSPAARLSSIHEINHHDEFQHGDDWSRYDNARGIGVWRLLTYCAVTSWRFGQHRRYLSLSPAERRELWTQRASVLIFFAVFAYFRPALFLFVFAPSWWIGLYFLLAGNLLTHDGCELTSGWNHSRNFLNSAENWFLFNHGFHTAHHVDQQTHWSRLPSLHEEACTGKVDGRFEVNSYFFYLAKHYTIFSEKRKAS